MEEIYKDFSEFIDKFNKLEIKIMKEENAYIFYYANNNFSNYGALVVKKGKVKDIKPINDSDFEKKLNDSLKMINFLLTLK
jgi:hypothetical protein